MIPLRHLATLWLLFLASCHTSPEAPDALFAIRLVHPRNTVLTQHRISEGAIEVSGYERMQAHPSANTNMIQTAFWVSETAFLYRKHLSDAKTIERATVIVMDKLQYQEFVAVAQTVNPDATMVPYSTYRARIENLAAEIQLDFTKEGRQLLSHFTRRHRNRRIAITIDRRVLAAPVIMAHIKSGSLILSSGFSKDEAKRVARQLLQK